MGIVIGIALINLLGMALGDALGNALGNALGTALGIVVSVKVSPLTVGMHCFETSFAASPQTW